MLSLQRVPLTTAALGVVALVLAFLIGRDALFPPAVSTAANIRTTNVSVGTVRSVVSATGSLVPLTAINLGFKSSGEVAEVDVHVGDRVAAGQVLAKIDPTNAQTALDQANATLAQAESNLANTVNGTALVQAQHSLQQAQQAYNDTANQVATTNQNDQNQLSSDQNQYNSDNAQLAADQASYWYQQYQPSLQSWQNQFNGAQADYRAQGCSSTTNYNGTPPAPAPSNWSSCQSDVNSMSSAQGHIACIQQGGISCTTQEQQMAAAYKAVIADQARMAGDVNRISADQQKLSIDQMSGQRSLDQAQNAITNAQDGINSQSVNRGTTIQAEQASVQVAQDNVKTAQKNLDGAVMTAPFAGIVTAVNGAVGDTASASNNATVLNGTGSSSPSSSASSSSSSSNSSSAGSGSGFITLSDISAFQVVAPFAEADASRVQPGQAASINFDAVQNLTLPAHVALVAPSSTVTSNVVNYNVTFTLDQTDPRLKSGMTSNIVDTVASASGVLVVPNSALTRVGSRAFVTVLDSSGKQVRQQVQTGVTGDSSTQITSGVTSGQKIVLPQLRTSSQASTGQRGAGGFGGGPGAGGVRIGAGG